MKKIISTIVLISMLVLTLMQVGWAAVYYVSSSIGDDNNTGTSPSSPWVHHPWDLNATGVADSTSLQPGDVVYLRMGDKWYNTALVLNTNGNDSNYIITTCTSSFSDGSGNLPLVSGALDPSNLTWVLDGSSYRCDNITTEPQAVYYNDVALTENDKAKETVGLNEWDWDTNSLWINIGTNPNGKSVYIPQRNYVINTNGKAYLTFRSLSLKHANSAYSALYIYNSNNVNVSNCVIACCPVYIVRIRESSQCQIGGCIIYNAPTYGIYFQNANNNVVNRCTIHGIWNHQPYPVSTGTGVLFGGSSSSNIVKRSIFHNNRWAISQLLNSSNGGNKVYYNLFYDQIVNTINLGDQTTGDPIEVINNTIFHNPSLDKNGNYTGHGIVAQSTVGNYSKVINNLVFVNKIGPNSQGIVIANTYNEITLDYNCVYGIEGAHLYKYRTTNYDSLAEWQAAVQGDANIKGLDGNSSTAASHSIASDPLLISSYRLSRNSPCIDAGIKLPIHGSNWRDLAGNRIRYGTAPDIGCYEKKTWPLGAWGMLPWIGGRHKVQWTPYKE